MSTQQRENPLYKDGRIELAIQAFKKGQFKSLRAAALEYDVPITTTRRRAAGTHSRREVRNPNRKLSDTEEESLLQWVLSMDRRGMPPRPGTVRQMANLLLAERSKTTTPPTVGKNWVQAFVQRHDELRSRYNRKYDYERAKCEDPAELRRWFQHVKDIIAEHGIVVDDQYNFDETGFQMGVIATARVITGTDRAGRPRTTQPGNREWVTAIEAISAAGFAIPPFIILEGIMH